MTKVLVIDDNPAMRTIVGDTLRKDGFEVLEAENGNRGLEQLDQLDPPKIIVTDIIMPEKEGLETIIEILAQCPKAYIIAMSGGGTMDKSVLLEMARGFGAQETLAKPFDPAVLLSLVKNQITHH